MIRILAREAGKLEDNISQTYENWFIETCEEWVVPYLPDLLGVRNLHPIDSPSVYSQRAYVANTLSYRRRKGTVPVLEQLALDITGWRTRADEFFQFLSHTQNINHVRIENGRFSDIRNSLELEHLGSAFDTFSHTADVRHIDNNRGRFNIPNVGLFVWRLQNYTIKKSDARPVGIPGSGCYSLNPLGKDLQLFHQPQTETTITHIATELNVPCALSRRTLYAELEQRRNSVVNGKSTTYGFFGPLDTDQISSPSACKIYMNHCKYPIDTQGILTGKL
ncbi:MAG: hypothetical protein WCL00_12420 [Bacteroidota bacterium]